MLLVPVVLKIPGQERLSQHNGTTEKTANNRIVGFMAKKWSHAEVFGN